MQKLLEIQLKICQRYNRNLSYALLAIDNFENIVATYGQTAGVNASITLANLLQQQHRDSDILGHDDNDQTFIIFPETDEKSALVTLERFRKTFTAIHLDASHVSFHATISGGIASYPNFSSVACLVKAAANALTYSQKHGGNRVTIWDKQLIE